MILGWMFNFTVYIELYIQLKKGNIMVSNHRIDCVTKRDRPNPHERITHVGGANSDGSRWKLSQEDAIRDIERGKYAFYVVVNRRRVNVVVAVSRYGNKYLKTEADGVQPNNLLNLPECG